MSLIQYAKPDYKRERASTRGSLFEGLTVMIVISEKFVGWLSQIDSARHNSHDGQDACVSSCSSCKSCQEHALDSFGSAEHFGIKTELPSWCNA